MYLAAISWDLSPSEFWAMTIPEWCLLEEFHTGRAAKKRVADGLKEDLTLSREEWLEKHGTSKHRS